MGNIVSLSDVRRHLRFPNPNSPCSEDTSIQWFINAADEVIEFECDDVLPQSHVETYDGGDFVIYTRHVPVLDVQNVEEGWGWINYELDYQEVNANPPYSMFAYSVDNFENGAISRRSAGNIQIPFRPGTSNIQIAYRSGEKEVPGNIFLAELELIAHWYQNSQLRAVSQAGTNVSYDSVGGAIYSRDSESGLQSLNIGVPYRILELIKGSRHRPIIA